MTIRSHNYAHKILSCAIGFLALSGLTQSFAQMRPRARAQYLSIFGMESRRSETILMDHETAFRLPDGLGSCCERA
jgi:hypothetical protein